MGQKQDCNKSNAHPHAIDFATTTTTTKSSWTLATTNPSTVGISVISPGKCINLLTECIQQLQQLLEKGNITHEQYEKLQSTILSDIYKF